MKPFQYHCPSTLKEATELLARLGKKARPLAGGTDLLVKLRLGTLAVEHVVDIKRIEELTRITFDPRQGLTIGAAASCAEICEHREASRRYPGLVDAASLIGGAAIQGRATLGGNLCNASPSADSIPALMVAGARCLIVGPKGRRWVPASEFCTGPGRTVLASGELLAAVRIPPPAPRSGAAYLRFIPRGEMDIAVAGVGAWVALQDGVVRQARVALAAVAPRPLLVHAAGAALAGRPPGEASYAEAAEAARKASSPISDVRGTAEQRRHLVRVLTLGALEQAAERAHAARSGR